MRKRRAVKKMKVKSPEPSSSKSNRKRTMDKTNNVNSQKEKKLKKETKTIVQESSINDLPPEMLMEVLKNVDTKSLVACRLVSKKWNGIATEILQLRPDLELHFNYSKDHGHRQGTGKSLLSLIECYKSSNNFPFAHFYFLQVDPSSFDQRDWIKFISDLGKNIKGLKLAVNSKISKVVHFITVSEKVRDLLLIKLPELEKFGLYCGAAKASISAAIQLFSTCAEKSGSKTISTYQRLPYLKFLYLDSFMLSNYTGIATDLLRASVNLQQFDSFKSSSSFDLDNFCLLQSLQKLDCLQSSDMCISVDAEFLSNLKVNSPDSLTFKLKTLNLFVSCIYENKAVWSDASRFLSHFFESNKDTLREINMEPLGFLPSLQLPKFNKLTTLCAREEDEADNSVSQPLFQSGINLMEIFPVLRSLDLRVPWTNAFPNEGHISGIPTLETLKVTGKRMEENFIPQISLLCPNLKDLHISTEIEDDYPVDNFPKVGRAIWTHLKNLQSLKIGVSVYCEREDGFPAFDSCITGFSKKDCKRIYNLLLADKLLRENGSRVKVPKSELEAERKFPSILDLKDLKYFELNVLWGDVDDDLIGPTSVSEKCALDLMDNLKYHFNKTV